MQLIITSENDNFAFGEGDESLRTLRCYLTDNNSTE